MDRIKMEERKMLKWGWGGRAKEIFMQFPIC
jgi:hypothetical protein